MNYVTLIDSNDDEYSTRVVNIMKAFNFPLDCSSTNLPDLVDVQAIMKEGKVQDLAKCIQNVLNYNLNPLTNNSIRILDPSFVTLFHLAQFVIKFILFWKTNLFNENVKLQNQLQELEKLRRDFQLKRLEARDLRKQLSINLHSKNAVVSECSQCKKIFVNDTYLLAHHKRRHGNQPFVSSGSDFQFLQSEMFSLKQQLIDVNSPPRFMKMKMVPEMGCLESQEKYWKGKVKELRDNFEEEKRKLDKVICDLEIENTRLNNKLTPETKSIQVQTESSDFVMNSNYFKPLEVQQCSSSSLLSDDFSVDSLRSKSTCDISSSAFHRWSLDSHNRPQLSSLRKNIDVVDQVDSFLVGYNNPRKSVDDEKCIDQEFLATSRNERREEVRKVIAKLFTSDESSEELAEKLIKIYDKRGSLVEETSCESNSSRDEAPVPMLVKTPERKANDGVPLATFVMNSENEAANPKVYCENTTLVKSYESVTVEPETTVNSFLVKTALPAPKQKSKFFPFLKNIPTKIMKNYIKSRKVRAEVVEDEIANRFDNQSKESPTEVETNYIEISKATPRNRPAESQLMLRSHESAEAEDKPSEVKLVSALKKSKSTGNLVKKVMFTDEKPTVRTYSESELPRSSVFETRSISNTVVATVDVHYDKLAIPVPAPRARKNIVSSKDTIS